MAAAAAKFRNAPEGLKSGTTAPGMPGGQRRGLARGAKAEALFAQHDASRVTGLGRQPVQGPARPPKAAGPWSDRTMPVAELKGMGIKTSGLDEGRVANLAADMRRNGFRGGPVQVEKTNRETIMTDGHHRLAAAERAGIKNVPVRVYDNTPEGRRAANRAMVDAEAAKDAEAAGFRSPTVAKVARPSTFELGARSKSASGADAPPLKKLAAPGAGRTRISPAAKQAVARREATLSAIAPPKITPNGVTGEGLRETFADGATPSHRKVVRSVSDMNPVQWGQLGPARQRNAGDAVGAAVAAGEPGAQDAARKVRNLGGYVPQAQGNAPGVDTPRDRGQAGGMTSTTRGRVSAETKRAVVTPQLSPEQRANYDKLLGNGPGEGLIKNKSARQIVEQMEQHGWTVESQSPTVGLVMFKAPDGRELGSQFLIGEYNSKPRFFTGGAARGRDLTFKAALAHVVTPTLEAKSGGGIHAARKRLGLPDISDNYSDPTLKPFRDANQAHTGYGTMHGPTKTTPEVIAQLRGSAENNRRIADQRAAYNRSVMGDVGGSGPIEDDNSRLLRQRASEMDAVAAEMEKMEGERAAYVAERDRRAALPLDIRPTPRSGPAKPAKKAAAPKGAPNGVRPTDGRPDVSALLKMQGRNRDYDLGHSRGRPRSAAPDAVRAGNGFMDGQLASAEILNPTDGTGDYRYRIYNDQTGATLEEGTGRDLADVKAKVDRIYSSQRGGGMARTVGNEVRYEARSVERKKDPSRGDFGRGPFYDHQVVEVRKDGSEFVRVKTSSASRAAEQAAEMNAKEGVTPKGAIERASDAIAEQRGLPDSRNAALDRRRRRRHAEAAAPARASVGLPEGVKLASPWRRDDSASSAAGTFRRQIEVDGERYTVSHQGVGYPMQVRKVGEPFGGFAVNFEDWAEVARQARGRGDAPANIMADEPGPAPISSARTLLANPNNPAAAYETNDRATNIILARQAGISVRGKSNDQLAGALRAKDEENRAKRAKKLNPAAVGTPSTQHQQHTTNPGDDLHARYVAFYNERSDGELAHAAEIEGVSTAGRDRDALIQAIATTRAAEDRRIEGRNAVNNRILEGGGTVRMSSSENRGDRTPSEIPGTAAARRAAPADSAMARLSDEQVLNGLRMRGNQSPEGQRLQAEVDRRGLNRAAAPRPEAMRDVYARHASVTRAEFDAMPQAQREQVLADLRKVRDANEGSIRGLRVRGFIGSKGWVAEQHTTDAGNKLHELLRVLPNKDDYTVEGRARRAAAGDPNAIDGTMEELQAISAANKWGYVGSWKKTKALDYLRDRAVAGSHYPGDDLSAGGVAAGLRGASQRQAIATLDALDAQGLLSLTTLQQVAGRLGVTKLAGKDKRAKMHDLAQKVADLPKAEAAREAAPGPDATTRARVADLVQRTLDARNHGEAADEVSANNALRAELARSGAQFEAPAASVTGPAYVHVTGRDKFGSETSGTGFVQGASRVNLRRGRSTKTTPAWSFYITSTPSGANGTRHQVIVPDDGRVQVLPTPEMRAAPETPKAPTTWIDKATGRVVTNPGQVGIVRGDIVKADSDEGKAAVEARAARRAATPTGPVTGPAALEAAPLRIHLGKLRNTPQGMTPQQAQAAANALEHYRDIGYLDLNRDLRIGSTNNKTIARTMEGLRGAFAASPLQRDVVTYRGTGDLKMIGSPKAGSAVGKTWTDAAPGSTTIDEATARGFGQGGAVLRIKVPAGVGAVQLSDAPGRGKPDDREGELLLQDGLTYRVTGDRVERGVRVLDVEASRVDTSRDSRQTGGVSNAPTMEANMPNARQQAVIDIGTNFSGNPYFKLPKLEALTDEDFRGLTPNQQDNLRFLVHKLTQRAPGESTDQAKALQRRFGTWGAAAPSAPAAPAKPRSKLAHGQDSMLRAIDAIEREIGSPPKSPSGNRTIVYGSDEWNSPAEVAYREALQAWRRRASEITQEVGSQHTVSYSGMHAQALQDKGLIEPYEYGKSGEIPQLTAAARKHLAETSPTPRPARKAALTGAVSRPLDRAPNGYTAPIPADRKERLNDKAFTDHVKTLTLTAGNGDQARAWGFSPGDDRPVQVGDEVMVNTFDRLRRGIVTDVTRNGMGNARIAYATPSGGYVQETTAPHADVWQLVDPTKRPRENRAARTGQAAAPAAQPGLSAPFNPRVADGGGDAPRIPGESDFAYRLRTAPSDDYALRILNGYNAAGLRAIARDEQVPVRSGASKPDLINAIMEIRRRWQDSQAIRRG